MMNQKIKGALSRYEDPPHKTHSHASAIKASVSSLGKTNLCEYYTSMQDKIEHHLSTFKAVIKKLQTINDKYYMGIAKLVEEQRIQVNAMIEAHCEKYLAIFREKKSIIKHKVDKIHCKKTNCLSREEKQSIDKVMKIKMPVFQIAKSKPEEIQEFLHCIKPQYISSVSFMKKTHLAQTTKMNMECQEKDEQATVKREKVEKQKEKQKQKSSVSSFDLSCNEELSWEPNYISKSHKMVDEIIMEEPSSCEDSLIGTQIG